jgi:hypothetical protein
MRYYKKGINSNLEDQKYLCVLTSLKKKISIDKIRINSHKLHSEIEHWTILIKQWDETICHLSDTKRDEDEKHFS